MGSKGGMIRTGLKYLRDCVKTGPGEAGRRIREKREDERIREARTRKMLLPPETES